MQRLSSLLILCLWIFSAQSSLAAHISDENYYNGRPSASYSNCQRTAGWADSYVLALSWQPAFCESYGYEAGKAECNHLSADRYASQYFSLHGLWPNQKACGLNYAFCGVKQKKHHCDYQALMLNSSVSADLKELMPSYAAGTCLERHEWYKHGSCQNLNEDAYFAKAMALAREFNQSAFSDYVRQHIGETIEKKSLLALIKQSFGADALQKIAIACKDGLLLDVYIYLPEKLDADSLQALLNDTEPKRRADHCPVNITISDFSTMI